MPVTIPDSHHDLFVKPVHAVLTTMMPDGQPQSSVVWVDYDGRHVLVNTTLERQKGRNMQANPRVSLLVVDPQRSERWIQIRGCVVEMVREGAEAHADGLTARYSGGRQRRFYGDIHPIEQRDRETRVIVRIEPVKISLDAVFK
jgi:PPOX class probable F420-dependent enzyme